MPLPPLLLPLALPLLPLPSPLPLLLPLPPPLPAVPVLAPVPLEEPDMPLSLPEPPDERPDIELHAASATTHAAKAIRLIMFFS